MIESIELQCGYAVPLSNEKDKELETNYKISIQYMDDNKGKKPEFIGVLIFN